MIILILFNFSEMQKKCIHGGSMLDVVSKIWHWGVESFKGLRKALLVPRVSFLRNDERSVRPSVRAACFPRTAMYGFVLMLATLASGVAGSESTESGSVFAVLVFCRTAGFRHDSIASGVAAIRALGEQNDFRVDASEDAAIFNDESLVQ